MIQIQHAPLTRHCRKIRNILMGSVWNMYPMVMKDGPEPYRMFLLQSPKVLLSLLVGLSGCGKSTTASLLMRFCDAAAGHIYMDGKDYHSMKPEELRKHIAMVPQQVNLFSGTIRENLLLADPDADDQSFNGGCKRSGTFKICTVTGKRT